MPRSASLRVQSRGLWREEATSTNQCTRIAVSTLILCLRYINMPRSCSPTPEMQSLRTEFFARKRPKHCGTSWNWKCRNSNGSKNATRSTCATLWYPLFKDRSCWIRKCVLQSEKCYSTQCSTIGMCLRLTATPARVCKIGPRCLTLGPLSKGKQTTPTALVDAQPVERRHMNSFCISNIK